MTASILDTLGLTYLDVAQVAGSSINANSSIVDMAGWEGCLFLTPITASVTGGVATMKVQQNSTNATGGMTDASGASAQATSAATNDLQGKFLAIDIYRPQKR